MEDVFEHGIIRELWLEVVLFMCLPEGRPVMDPVP